MDGDVWTAKRDQEMTQAPITPEQRYVRLVEDLLGNAEVTQSEKKGFGSSALCTRGSIFAMLVRGQLVVKLPRARVDALVAEGKGERFDPRHDGRLMKEWLAIGSGYEEEWLPLAREALAFVGTKR
jgi:hypothetical protein